MTTKKRPSKLATTEAARVVVRELPCKLSPTELLERGDALAELYAEADQLEVDKKQATDSYKAKIEIAEGGIRRLAKTIKTRLEVRDVECHEFMLYETGIVRTIRTDTGETVNDRPMRNDERQGSLSLPPEDAADYRSFGGDGDTESSIQGL